jgi:hypothetical protein
MEKEYHKDEESPLGREVNAMKKKNLFDDIIYMRSIALTCQMTEHHEKSLGSIEFYNFHAARRFYYRYRRIESNYKARYEEISSIFIFYEAIKIV